MFPEDTMNRFPAKGALRLAFAILITAGPVLASSVSDFARARFLVLHTNAPALASDIMQRLRARLGGIEPKMLGILEAGPVIATHGGPGAVGIFSAQD